MRAYLLAVLDQHLGCCGGLLPGPRRALGSIINAGQLNALQTMMRGTPHLGQNIMYSIGMQVWQDSLGNLVSNFTDGARPTISPLISTFSTPKDETHADSRLGVIYTKLDACSSSSTHKPLIHRILQRSVFKPLDAAVVNTFLSVNFLVLNVPGPLSPPFHPPPSPP